MKNKLKLILLGLSIMLALFALWQVEPVARQVKESEEAKIRLWANAIAQRNGIAEVTQEFFEQAMIDEHRKMRLYTDILQSFNDPDQSVDLRFSLAYINYVVDSAKTPIIITTAKDSIITVPQELAGQKLEGALLEDFSQNPPFDYKLWGMPMRLYYKESQYFTQLRHVLTGFTRSFLADITNNSVIVPVVIVDSSQCEMLAKGNIDEHEVDTKEKLHRRLNEMRSENDPIEITLPDGGVAYVFYENSRLLDALSWVPLFYLFIGIVLVAAAYYMFRTTRRMEQNRIWVGLAKETAHQLGTPISSLTGWIEYLKGKEFSDTYAQEVSKDLQRLETITHRFSKIGSVPELKEENVKEVVDNAVTYLQSRVPKKVKFNVSFPEEDFFAPLNRYLFEWVIENLCKNAIDAMEGAGTISIVASQDARRIYIDVSDTGRGMSKAIQRKIFDSGFTTKSRGWGLGLPLARRIINQYHRGRLFLKYSIPGQGSAFRIELKKK